MDVNEQGRLLKTN